MKTVPIIINVPKGLTCEGCDHLRGNTYLCAECAIFDADVFLKHDVVLHTRKCGKCLYALRKARKKGIY